jgi:diaminobutyrate-2-oxoglutarate transaminase
MSVFEQHESVVRSYCRSWPAVFSTAKGSYLHDEDGRPYLDFFAGAGALNYGHNNPVLKQPLLDYLHRDGVVHGLDMSTTAKGEFLGLFQDLVLRPRGLDYKVMFPGPTGTNAVEAALKLARKVTGRQNVVFATNGFHGMTLGSLSVTGNAAKRRSGGVPLSHSSPIPYGDDPVASADRLAAFEQLLDNPGSGLDEPAAVIVETVQGEGGLNVADPEWLRGLAEVCQRHEILLVVDDVQMGCGRTGEFFSFEEAGIVPDVVALSKSISGYGLPMALTLIKPELDVWQPGEHNGTFRGHNPAFVTAAAAVQHFWDGPGTAKQTLAHAEQVESVLSSLAEKHAGVHHRGRGLAWGLEISEPGRAEAVCGRAFGEGLLLETSGPDDEVIKLLPPLTISTGELTEGLDILTAAVDAAR